MRLSGLCEVLDGLQLPSAEAAVHPDRGIVQHVRAAVQRAVQGEEFLVSCIAHELQDLRSERRRRGLTPFYRMPSTGVRFALGYWQPGATPGPHEHTAWTVTAVCHNRLDVSTYDRAASYETGALVPKNVFQAEAGQVGYIFEPSIHCPKNTSDRTTLSLHISSPRDGEPVNDYAPLESLASFGRMRLSRHPYMTVVDTRERERQVTLLVEILSDLDVTGADDAIRDAFALASTPTRRMIQERFPDWFREPEASRVLQRAHPELDLEVRDVDGACVLYAHAPSGPVEIFRVTASHVGKDALRTIASSQIIEAGAFAGLEYEEEEILSDTLETSGLFRRSKHACQA